jgi:hypothetical protein
VCGMIQVYIATVLKYAPVCVFLGVANVFLGVAMCCFRHASRQYSQVQVCPCLRALCVCVCVCRARARASVCVCVWMGG